MPVDVEQVAGPGDFPGGTDEGYLQPSAFRYCIALKQNRQSLLILGHEGRLPPSAAPLIEKIRESVFIFARVTRELHDHSLVFFHRELEIMSP